MTKATKEFVDASGRRKVKGNMDIELAVDAIELAPHIDQMVLFSGHGDFCCLEPISKSSEEDNEAGELDEAEEVLGVIFPADEDAALPLDPSKEALDQPASHVAA